MTLLWRLQGTKVVSQDNKNIQAASFTQARTHACVLARQLQDSQKDIQELLLEAASWQKLATEAAMHLQQRDAEVCNRHPGAMHCFSFSNGFEIIRKGSAVGSGPATAGQDMYTFAQVTAGFVECVTHEISTMFQWPFLNRRELLCHRHCMLTDHK